MKERKLGFYFVIGMLILPFFFLSSCGWFSDNPMFPKAKISISGEIVPSSTSSSEESTASGSKNLGLVRFTFTPLNKVGVQITQYRLEYRKADGSLIPSLTSTVGISVDIIPPETPMASNAGIENVSVTREIDLLPPDVEAYLKSNRIPAVLVTITFSGVDYATHVVSYRGGEFRFNMLEGLPKVELVFFCTVESCSLLGGSTASGCPLSGSTASGCPLSGSTASGTSSMVNIGCALQADDPAVITQVEFYINGEAAGVDTVPPFISNTVRTSRYSTVAGTAVVHDINGGVSTVTKTAKAQEICPAPEEESNQGKEK